MKTTQFGLNKDFPYCIRDNEVYCSTLCRNGTFERSPLDENVKTFRTKEIADKYIELKHINGHSVIPYLELEK